MGSSVVRWRPVEAPGGEGHRVDGGIAALLDALEAARFAGTWVWGVPRGGVVLDHGAAALITGGTHAEGEALGLDAFVACVHPEDRDWVRATLRLHQFQAGPVERHYRVQWPSGETRAIHARGTLEAGPDGTITGRGIMFDLTDRGTRAAPPEGDARLHLYDTTIDHALMLREAVRRLEGEPSVTLVDTLLLSLCEDAAAALRPDTARRRH